MYLYCARIYVGGVKLADAQKIQPRARKSGRRIYVGYDNAVGDVYQIAEKIVGQFGGFIESEAD
jgi:hypothetical protein